MGYLVRRGAVARAALLTVVWVGSASLLASADSGPTLEGHSYVGAGYGPLADAEPTQWESQSKLWFHDGAWWALMAGASGGSLTVCELLADHSWRPASDPLATGVAAVGDVLRSEQGADVVYSAGGAVNHLRLVYDSGNRRYVPAAQGVAEVYSRPGASAGIARDSTGRLWSALAAGGRMLVTTTTADGITWKTPFVPTALGTGLGGGEIAAIVSFDESIGVMWSDQGRDQFVFATHRDGAPDNEWAQEIALRGEGLADDHISPGVVDGEQGDTVVAAVKTSQGDRGEAADSPLMLVLARSPAGEWTNHVAGTVADDHNSPLLVVDATNREVYFVAHAPAAAGTVYYKRASVDDLTFPPGLGTRLVYGDAEIAHPTAGERPVSDASGMVVLASEPATHRYHHAELVIPTPDGEQPPPDGPGLPPPPEGLVGTPNGSDSIALYWSPSVDTTQWAPGGDGSLAADYVVLRDGQEVGTTDALSFVDRPPTELGTYEYSVVAVDGAGNRSPTAATASVTMAATSGVDLAGLRWWAIGGVGVIVLAAVGVGRSRLGRA